VADKPDYRKLDELLAEDAYGKAPDELPRTPAVTEKPPQSFFAVPDVPALRMPVPTPDLRVLGLSKNPRIGADYNVPMMGGVLGLGMQGSPLAPLSGAKVDPSFSLRYKRQF
jgi:hypothetical protein